MKRWSLALVWMLLLALPLQGLAAVSQRLCHHGSAPAAAAPCHEEAGSDTGTAAHAGCIACAACHGLTALPTTLPGLPPAPAPSVPAAAVEAPAPVFLTSGPERPPRAEPA